MDENNPKPRRYWRPRFGLRTLFVVVTVAGLGCWVANSLIWIRQRREMTFPKFPPGVMVAYKTQDRVAAPRGLWLFGEEGMDFIYYGAHASDQSMELAKRLFPEARVEFKSNWSRHPLTQD